MPDLKTESAVREAITDLLLQKPEYRHPGGTKLIGTLKQIHSVPNPQLILATLDAMVADGDVALDNKGAEPIYFLTPDYVTATLMERDAQHSAQPKPAATETDSSGGADVIPTNPVSDSDSNADSSNTPSDNGSSDCDLSDLEEEIENFVALFPVIDSDGQPVPIDTLVATLQNAKINACDLKAIRLLLTEFPPQLDALLSKYGIDQSKIAMIQAVFEDAKRFINKVISAG